MTSSLAVKSGLFIFISYLPIIHLTSSGSGMSASTDVTSLFSEVKQEPSSRVPLNGSIAVDVPRGQIFERLVHSFH